jgi:hypothetical protein
MVQPAGLLPAEHFPIASGPKRFYSASMAYVAAVTHSKENTNERSDPHPAGGG